MRMPIKLYERMLDQLDMMNYELSENIIKTTDTDYHYVLDAMNLRNSEEVEVDRDFILESKDEIIKALNSQIKKIVDYQGSDLTPEDEEEIKGLEEIIIWLNENSV